ncbi:hypothetical protein SAMN02910355_1375 [Terrisporobacter glycolicus]|nr:hypothetical protein SAMN02910355_1375 [Terrisporobacter glycolicus]
MDAKKKKIIDNILNKSLTIRLDDLGAEKTSKDKCYIKFTYINNIILNSSIKRNSKNYSLIREYDDQTIVRDEIYASYYESLLELSDKYTLDELIEILNDFDKQENQSTRKFIALINGYIDNKVKLNIIDASRRDQSDKSYNLIDIYITYYGDDTLIESLINENIYNQNTNLNNDFNSWVSDNKESLLTKTQLKYYNNEKIYANNKTINNTKYKIRDKVLSKQHAPQSQQEARALKINNMINTIEELLNIENIDEFARELKKKQSKTYISDSIITHVSKDSRISFNKGQITKDVIKDYRTALFKQLNALHDLIGSWE